MLLWAGKDKTYLPTLVDRMNIFQSGLPYSTKEGTQITRGEWIPPETFSEAQKDKKET